MSGMKPETKKMFINIMKTDDSIYVPEGMMNPVKINNNVITVYCRNKDEQYESYYDLEDFDKLKNIGLIIVTGGLKATNKYAFTAKVKQLHRHILGDIPSGKIIDHINRNGLDNRKENLKIATPGENMLNKRDYKTNKTGIRNLLKTSKNLYKVGFHRIFHDKEIGEKAASAVTKILDYYSDIDAKKRKTGHNGEQIE